jgi:hypothetical protein
MIAFIAFSPCVRIAVKHAPRDILLETNRPGSFGLAGAALRAAESSDIQRCFGPAFFS